MTRDFETIAKRSFALVGFVAETLGLAGSISALVACTTAEAPIGLQSRTAPQAVLYLCAVHPVPSDSKVGSLFVNTWLSNVLYYSGSTL